MTNECDIYIYNISVNISEIVFQRNVMTAHNNSNDTL